MPDWDRQKYLCVVPCRTRDDKHWRREMLCSTLGDMFRVLGKDHSGPVQKNRCQKDHFYRSAETSWPSLSPSPPGAALALGTGSSSFLA